MRFGSFGCFFFFKLPTLQTRNPLQKGPFCCRTDGSAMKGIVPWDEVKHLKSCHVKYSLKNKLQLLELEDKGELQSERMMSV